MDNQKRVVTIIPAGTGIELSQEVYYYMLMQVPFGKLTQRKDIEEYLAKKFNVQHIYKFNRAPMNMRNLNDINQKYIIKIIDTVPFHREVSSGGYLEHEDSQIQKLLAEGHVIITKGPHKKSAVKDFKMFLFDFNKETDIDIDTLRRIDQEGLSNYL